MIQDLIDPPVAGLRGDPLGSRMSESIGCPLCRRPISHPEPCRDGSRPMVECIACDLYFDPGDGGSHAAPV